VLKKNLGLIQSGRVSQELVAMTGGLQKIIEASTTSDHQKSVLQSLIQAQSADSDEDLDMQPQATAAAYESKSDGILDTIADMQSATRAQHGVGNSGLHASLSGSIWRGQGAVICCDVASSLERA